MTASDTTQSASKHPVPLLARWKMVLDGCNVPNIELADPVTRWLVISRSCVFTMSLTSGLLGLMIAAEQAVRGKGEVNWLLGTLAVLGVVIAHASNNLINDFLDVRQGVDTEDYPRAQYSPHPLLGGLTTPRGLLTAALILTLIDAAIMAYLFLQLGITVVYFAVAGFLLSLFYTNLLKRAVLVAKHIDKIGADKKVGVRTIPVLLGEEGARALNKATFILFYALILALVLLGYTGPGVLLTFLAFGRLRTTWGMYSKPRPKKAPEGWTVWPLWYVGWAMHFNRQAGEFFTIGLLINTAWPYLTSLFS